MNNQLNKIENLVFGCSGSIGLEISKKLNRNKTLLLSRKKPKALKKCKWIKLDLNGDINHLPKNVERIFFLSSPYYIKKKFKYFEAKQRIFMVKKNFKKYINTKTFVYFSSRSVYYRKHPLGLVKKKCEAFFVKKKISIFANLETIQYLGKI